MNNTSTPESSRLHEVLGILRRYAWVLLASCLTCAGVALALSLTQDKTYSATAQLLFRNPALDQQLFGSTALPPSQDPTREAATNLRLVGLGTVSKLAARELGGKLGAKVSVAAQGQSNVVSVTASAASPQRAARVANVFSQQYIVFRREADRSKIKDAQRLIEAEITTLSAGSPKDRSRARPLRNRASELSTLAALQTGNAELVQEATPPTSPSSPRPVRNTIVGLLLGLVLGGALVALVHALDRRIRRPEEASAQLDAPLIGYIPRFKRAAEKGEPLALANAPAEHFRMLRANLHFFHVDRALSSIIITSAALGDGKSTVAWNLAAASATGQTKVLLIEADLHRPSFMTGFGVVQLAGGLSEVLAGLVDVDEVITSVELNGDQERSMSVLTAGMRLPPNPAELLGSARMEALIQQAEAQYDLVIIDTPPVSAVSDAIPLLERVTGVIPVVRINRTTRDAVRHLNDQLKNLHAPTLGVVVNGVEPTGGYYGGDYMPATGQRSRGFA